MKCLLGVYGWGRVVCPEMYLPPWGASWRKEEGRGCGRAAAEVRGAKIRPNPFPFPWLSVQLDGSRAAFVSANVGLLTSRDGRLYSLEVHGRRMRKKKASAEGAPGATATTIRR